jgi:hypothetical protein
LKNRVGLEAIRSALRAGAQSGFADGCTIDDVLAQVKQPSK